MQNKTLLIVSATVIAVLLPVYFFWYKPKFEISKGSIHKNASATNSKTILKLREKAINLKAYTKARSYNSDLCFLIDMSIESGRNRFFVYDMKKDSILLS